MFCVLVLRFKVSFVQLGLFQPSCCSQDRFLVVRYFASVVTPVDAKISHSR